MTDYMQLAAAVIPVLLPLLIWRSGVLTRREVHALRVTQQPASPPAPPDDVLIGTLMIQNASSKVFRGIYVESPSAAVHERAQEAFSSEPNPAKLILLGDAKVRVTEIQCVEESAVARIRAVTALFSGAEVRYTAHAKQLLGAPNEVALLRRSVKTLEQELAAVKIDRDGAKVREEAVSKSHLTACTRLDNATLMINEQGSEIGLLKKERDELQALYAKADDKVDALEEKYLAAMHECDEAKGRVADLENEINASFKEHTGEQKRLTKARDELQALYAKAEEAAAAAHRQGAELQRHFGRARDIIVEAIGCSPTLPPCG